MAVRRYNPDHKPPATLALVIINVAIALIDMFSGEYMQRLFWARGIDIQYGEFWRIFTNGFVHGNLMHIAFNAYGIWLLGTIFERLHGWKPMLIVYFASLFGGAGLAMTLMDPSTPLLGASGAAYGLFGAVLGFFYAKTGSIKGIWQVPMGRQLLIWLGIGIFISLRPGISLLGHVGGFVPGVILGVYFENRYNKQTDAYHTAAVGMLFAAIIGLVAFSIAPFTRASWYASRALAAYSDEDFDRGDELMEQADGRSKRDEGTRKLLTHLELWREGNRSNPEDFDRELLRWPLTHTTPLASMKTDSEFGMSSTYHVPFNFLDENMVYTEYRPIDDSDNADTPETIEPDANEP